MYVCSVCMYVCVFVVYVCNYVCMYVCMYICMYVTRVCYKKVRPPNRRHLHSGTHHQHNMAGVLGLWLTLGLFTGKQTFEHFDVVNIVIFVFSISISINQKMLQY